MAMCVFISNNPMLFNLYFKFIKLINNNFTIYNCEIDLRKVIIFEGKEQERYITAYSINSTSENVDFWLRK